MHSKFSWLLIALFSFICYLKFFTHYLKNDPKSYGIQLLRKADVKVDDDCSCEIDTENNSKDYTIQVLKTGGIKINGNRPWDIHVHNEQFYARVMQEGSIGLGEAYMDGWWDCEALDQLFYKIFSAELDQYLKLNWTVVINAIKAKLINLQSKVHATKIAEQHYNLGNDLYASMLDKEMHYSSGYWPEAKTLDEAQEHKAALICQKLKLRPGMRVLDVGCGWGGFARYAARHYGVEVVGITISKEQVDYATKHNDGLPITILLEDYRDHDYKAHGGKYDRIVSIGMFEHVGHKNYQIFMDIIAKSLKDDGLFLLHTIGGNVSNNWSDAWTLKYIFPNSMLPSMVQIAEAAEGILLVEDWHSFGTDYDTTLMAWFENFNKNWDTIKQKYDNRFYRMWKYYLLSCAGLFRARKAQLWQIVLSKKGVPNGYRSIR